MKKISVKLDINFLDKPLWFLDVRHDGKGFVWKDIDGYEYRSGHNLPNKVDFLFLLYLLYRSQQKGYQSSLNLSRWEIIKGCGFDTRASYYYKRLEDSLERWTNITLKFKGIFYDKTGYKTLLFGILDTGKVTENNRVIVEFNENWLLKIKETNFFKYIPFEYYKALKRPVSRRLFELVGKYFESCYFKLTTLGEKLTLTGTGKDGQIYASAVLVKIKPAINEINKLARKPDIAELTGIRKQDLFTLNYKVVGKKQDRVIYFFKQPIAEPEQKSKGTRAKLQKQNTTNLAPPNQTKMEAHDLLPGILDPKMIEESHRQQEQKEKSFKREQITTLFSLLKRKTEKLKEVIARYYEQECFDYVQWNIRYSNANAKKNYSTYLQKALAENWAREWIEDEKSRQQKEQERKQEEKRREERKREEEHLEHQRAVFKQKHDELPTEIKEKLRQQAEGEVALDQMGRQMHVKIGYVYLIRQYFEEHGESYPQEALIPLPFINEIAATSG